MDSNIFGGGTNLQALVDELDECFPPLNPSPRDTDREIMYRAGQRSVVEFLKEKLNNDRS